MLKTAITACGLFALLLTSATAEQFFASPEGNDADDCLSPEQACKTFSVITRKMKPGAHGLNLAAGTYDDTIDIFHGKNVNISGPADLDGKCLDPRAAIVKMVLVQDNATAWVTCLTAQHIGCRQWAIADVINV